MSRFSLVYVCLFSVLISSAQNKPGLIWPLDSPRVLTGNFGELRPNHFHTGLDFSTNGKENLQVYAIEEGYVSRIRVSPYGYGKALYITHANGKVSVYAHLNNFSLKIDKALNEEQYAKQNFEVDFYPKPWSLFVRKNEIIGLSGNTGGSSGPHLHFELRDEKTEIAINPLSVYHVTDKMAPVILELAFYDLTDTLQPLFLRSFNANGDKPATDTLELPTNLIGLAFEAYDQYLKNGNHNNVYEAKVVLDNQLLYHHRLNEMDFLDFRYVNEYCDYRNHSKLQKCFLPGVFPGYLYPEVKNKGRLILTDSRPHQLRLIVADESGNASECTVFIRAKHLTDYKVRKKTGDIFLRCRRDTSITKNHLSLHFPPLCLFNDVDMAIEYSEQSEQITILPSGVNFRSAFNLGIRLSENQISMKNHLLLKTEQHVIIPELRNDTLWFACKNFGSFKLVSDQTPPTVKSVLANKKRLPKSVKTQLEFFVTDDVSGIGKYALFINDQWVIAEYDAKSHRLSYRFEEQSPLGWVTVRLLVTDKVGNQFDQVYRLKR